MFWSLTKDLGLSTLIFLFDSTHGVMMTLGRTLVPAPHPWGAVSLEGSATSPHEDPCLPGSLVLLCGPLGHPSVVGWISGDHRGLDRAARDFSIFRLLLFPFTEGTH